MGDNSEIRSRNYGLVFPIVAFAVVNDARQRLNQPGDDVCCCCTKYSRLALFFFFLNHEAEMRSDIDIN